VAIDVLLHGAAVQVDEVVFSTLLANSVAGTYVDYERALITKVIKFANLEYLARRGDIPYSLFFSPLPVAQAQVAAKTKKLLAGVNKDTFQIGSREKVSLRDIELIVKDLMRKQELLKKHDSSLTRNAIVGILRKPGVSVEADAARLAAALGIDREELWACRTKEKALELMIGRLEASQILVSRSVQNYMPQRLTHVAFSGVTVRDAKVPYIFLAGGDHADHQEPVGRTIFTLALMVVLIARRIFAPVTWDAESLGVGLGCEYDIAAAILMPGKAFNERSLESLDDIKAAAERFKVTPSAVTVRARRLGLISHDMASSRLNELRTEFRALPAKKGMSQIRPENAVRKYAGGELSRRMLRALDARSISPREFCRTVCLNRLQPERIQDLRRVLT